MSLTFPASISMSQINNYYFGMIGFFHFYVCTIVSTRNTGYVGTGCGTNVGLKLTTVLLPQPSECESLKVPCGPEVCAAWITAEMCISIQRDKGVGFYSQAFCYLNKVIGCLM
ncbi:mCG147154, partial [Mus musculus]